MQARFKPGKNNPGITTPEWVELHRNKSFPLNEIIVSFDVDNQPLSYFTSDIWDFRAYVNTRSGNSQEAPSGTGKGFRKVFAMLSGT